MYYYIFQKRSQKAVNLDSFASFIVLNHKRAVDYRCLFKTFVSKNFDLGSRGLTEVFRNLMDRVHKEYEFPVVESKRGKHIKDYKTPSESKIIIALRILKDCWNKAITMVSAYLECVELLGGPETNYTEYLHSVGHLFILALGGEFEEYLKYQTASLVAITLSNDCDEAPDCVKRGHWRIGDFLPFARKAMFWIRKVCVQRRGPKGVQLSYSLYNVKRIAPAADELFIQKSLDKNLKALTEERSLPDVIRLREAVIRTVRELYDLSRAPRVTYDTMASAAHQRNKEIRARVMNCKCNSSQIPSLSACYENSKTNGGALGYLLNKTKLHIDFRFGELLLLGYVTRKDKFVEPVQVHGLLDEEELDCLMRPSLHGLGGRVVVRREAILEPFKVRIISKGEAVPYQRCKNYQPFLWSLLQLAECFELTGRPLEELDIAELMEFGKYSWQQTVIVSGDYSAATDNLHPYLCNTALQEIVRLWRIPYEDALNLSACLTGHIIDGRDKFVYKCHKFFRSVYELIYKGRVSDARTRMEELIGTVRSENMSLQVDEKEFFDQVWGQLMGSFVSFPILCIINAAVTRESMEKAYERLIKLTDKAFKVNGDDVLFCIPPSGYQTWVRNVISAGLTPSIGKNYVSRRYAVINSTIFDCGTKWDWLERSEIVVKKIPILYMNLLRGQEDSSTERRSDLLLFLGDDLSRGGDMASRMSALVEGWDHEHREKFLKRCYYYNHNLLKRLPPVSWYLPKCLGGLGLPKPESEHVSQHHLRIASMILCMDTQMRRDMVRLQWLKQPGNVFCELTNQQICDINEELGNKFILSSSKNEDEIYGRLIRSNLGYGTDETLYEPEQVLKSWTRLYQKWSKKVLKIKWTDSHDHSVKGLHSMNEKKALEYQGLRWTPESVVVWK
jgi:hypothetical protein